MNTINLTNLGGLPVTQYTLDFFQQSNLFAFQALAAFIGPKVILTGVETVGNPAQVTNGAIIINGEILEFVGGIKTGFIDIEETVATRVYKNLSTNPVYKTRVAKCVNAGAYPIGDFVRAGDALINSLYPKGIISQWGGAIADIPRGFALCDGTNGTPDLSDRFILGYNPNDPASVIGTPGGSKTKTIARANLPHEQLSINTGDRPGKSDNANDRDVMIPGGDGNSVKYTQYLGDGVAMDIMPPFYIFAYIQKL